LPGPGGALDGEGAGAAAATGGTREGDDPGAGGAAGIGGTVAGPTTDAAGAGMPVAEDEGCAPASPLRTTNTLAHLVHRTFTPRSVTLSSPILKRVWQEAH
jgi:hypothetical protein